MKKKTPAQLRAIAECIRGGALVEVVRCGECEHGVERYRRKAVAVTFVRCILEDRWCTTVFYCANGVRRVPLPKTVGKATKTGNRGK